MSDQDWSHVPKRFQYLKFWARRFGIRGLTVDFRKNIHLCDIVSTSELAILRKVYRSICFRQDSEKIAEWRHSLEDRNNPAFEAGELIRGLLLLIGRVGSYGVAPFSEGGVKYPVPTWPELDWSKLPGWLEALKPWLKKFEHLRTEADAYFYVEEASGEQTAELESFVKAINSYGTKLSDWCSKSDVEGSPTKWEAYQIGWMIVMADFFEQKLGES